MLGKNKLEYKNIGEHMNIQNCREVTHEFVSKWVFVYSIYKAKIERHVSRHTSYIRRVAMTLRHYHLSLLNYLTIYILQNFCTIINYLSLYYTYVFSSVMFLHFCIETRTRKHMYVNNLLKIIYVIRTTPN